MSFPDDSIREKVKKLEPLSESEALNLFRNDYIETEDLLDLAFIPRSHFFGKGVRIHILNNVQNGDCSEDCSYCAQRNTAEPGSIPSYASKTREEIIKEAEAAYESGAFRYCLVTAGKGPGKEDVRFLSGMVQEVKEKFPGMELCVSAGVVTDPSLAKELAEAGTDRYNHNLNTSIAHYHQICSTHDYNDRLNTLKNLSSAGVALCSGVIVGMGESFEDIVSVAAALRESGAASIPVNFFIPVDGHAVENPGNITEDLALRILCVFKLMNPQAEIRMAAGREKYLGKRQADALKAANSLFVSGYLNVTGSDLSATVKMIQEAGYTIDSAKSDSPALLLDAMQDGNQDAESGAIASQLRQKSEEELRPFYASSLR